MSIFKDKVLLITGGTGSFGNAVLKRFIETDIKEIRVFSRDELKQDDMRHEYQAKYPVLFHKLRFISVMFVTLILFAMPCMVLISSFMRQRLSKCLPVNSFR